ncbi:MAG: S41 family peptidase [Bacteroidales bacterium]|nr:S41 family peptidase [Bacteroidales bacterium]HNW74174.1 S41 family peptidase [Bacteroidales bacterium]HPS51424.1 S41 family peptidase [Bacteroidales bacterium]
MEKRYNPYLPVWFALVLIGGVIIGIVLATRSGNLGAFRSSGDKIPQVLKYVEDNYVDTVSGKALEEKAISGLLEKLDPHSVFITAEEFHEANDPLLGSFEGIGVQFRIENDTVTVIIPVAGGPSEKLGIRAGDRIVKVDGQNIAGIRITTNDVMRKLKGPKGTQVEVSIFRRGVRELLDFVITRDVIPTYSLDIAYMAAPGIGYIRLNNFSATTAEEVHNALQSLKESGMKKLILDLRGNGGGYLQAAVNVSDEFLPKSKLIVYTQGMHHPREVFNATADGIFEQGELLVLVDEGSASASEIVAGAVQDNDRGILMGRRTYGKGLVQEQLDFKDGSALRLTVARYYTPTGRCIQRSYKDGIENYNNDFYLRFMNGELEHPDSIKFPDSLKYRTPKGKIVYGGGGIMPDIYIPVERDSTLNYYTRCINKGLIYQFAFDYTDRNRSRLSEFKNIDRFDEGFVVTDALYQDFVRYAETKGVRRPEKNPSKSDRYIKTMLKAYIGRNILDNEGFFPILNTIDPGFLKAIEMLK